MSSEFEQFGVTLMVNHACNLRCSYCYTGAKFDAAMPWEIGVAGIERALRSTSEAGLLYVSFFGGEPLVESRRILDWMAYGRDAGKAAGKRVRFSLTTNGTITTKEAWRVMRAPDLVLAISHDGSPITHNRHRTDAAGRGTAHLVETTISSLISFGRKPIINVVVRPDTLDSLLDGLAHLQTLGIEQVNLSLDLWTSWTVHDAAKLEKSITCVADLWKSWLPEFSINWFDVKAAKLMGLEAAEADSRCGFGAGEIAIAPSGNLYPCERLIGEDRPDNPSRLAGHALDGTDFLNVPTNPFARCTPCSKCALISLCDTGCRCSNFIRTGDVNRPDGLLCRLNKATTQATAAVLARSTPHSNNSLQSPTGWFAVPREAPAAVHNKLQNK